MSWKEPIVICVERTFNYFTLYIILENGSSLERDVQGKSFVVFPKAADLYKYDLGTLVNVLCKLNFISKCFMQT